MIRPSITIPPWTVILAGLVRNNLGGPVRDVWRRTGIAPEGFLGRARHKSVAAARHELFLVLREPPHTLSFPDIGRLLFVDHTTVMSGIRKARLHRATREAFPPPPPPKESPTAMTSDIPESSPFAALWLAVRGLAPMTTKELRAQRIDWVYGQLMASSHHHITREQAATAVDLAHPEGRLTSSGCCALFDPVICPTCLSERRYEALGPYEIHTPCNGCGTVPATLGAATIFISSKTKATTTLPEAPRRPLAILCQRCIQFAMMWRIVVASPPPAVEP